jgi:hypothetical protein
MKMALLLSFTILLCCLMPTFSNAYEAEDYVSLECPDGDIQLSLKQDASFRLEKKYWDGKSMKHTRRESLIGSWKRSDKELILISAGTELHYKETLDDLRIAGHNAKLKSYHWISSSSPSFADSITLLEKKNLDASLAKASGN